MFTIVLFLTVVTVLCVANFHEVASLPQDDAVKLFNTMRSYLDLPAFSLARDKMVSFLDCNETIIDVGCGFGFDSVLLSDLGHNVTGVDVRNDLNILPSNSSFNFKVGSAYNLPFNDSSVLTVWGNRLIRHLHDVDKFFNEAYRVLSPGGKLVLSWPDPYDFVCSDLDATPILRKLFASSITSAYPAVLSDVCDRVFTIGFSKDFFNISHSSCSYSNPKLLYQGNNFFGLSDDVLLSVVSLSELYHVSNFMYDLATNNATASITLTTACFYKV